VIQAAAVPVLVYRPQGVGAHAPAGPFAGSSA
jgi:hypothetical protein